MASRKAENTGSCYQFVPCILHWVLLVGLGEMLCNSMYFNRLEWSQGTREESHMVENSKDLSKMYFELRLFCQQLCKG